MIAPTLPAAPLPATPLAGPDDPRWLALTEAVLAHASATAPLLQSVLADEPDLPRAQALRGLVALILGRSELRAVATDSLAKVRLALVNDAGWAGDRHYASGLEFWLAGRPHEAAACFDAALRHDPQDLLAFKLAQSIRFMQGDAEAMLGEATRQASVTRPGERFAGYVQGALAFAREELGDYDRAEVAGRLATILSPRDVWGRHAVAHVFEMTGRAEDGRTWLSRPQDWAHCNNFGCHMWWHLALFEMERGDHRRVLSLYDTMIRAEPTDDYRDVANAASLLMRLELEGVDVGSRWAELGQIGAARIHDHSLVFADLHYLMALAGIRDLSAAHALVESLLQATDTSSQGTTIMHGPGPALAEGVLAFGQGRHAAAVDLLLQAQPGIRAIGGSAAQRDVFEQMLIESALRAGRTGLAERLLRDRLVSRGGRNRFALTRLATLSRQPNIGVAALAAMQSRAMPAH